MPSLQHEVLTRAIPWMRRSPSPDDVEGLRARLAGRNAAVVESPPRAVRRGRQVTIANDAGFPVFTLECTGRRRRSGQARRTLFYLHGGGFVSPSDPRQWAYAARLADALGARLVFPAYPLAPDHTAADSHDAMAQVFAQAAEVSPDGVVLAGDSAGGGYALALAQTLRDRAARDPQVRTPSQLVLLSPWVDLTGQAPGTAEAAERDPWLSQELMPIYASFWAGSSDPADLLDPRVSPGLGYLAGLPPALVFSGTRDLLHPGVEALFARAEQADWPLELVSVEGLMHVYPLLPIPEARSAFDHAVAFCKR